MSESAQKFLQAVSYWKMALLKCACQVILGMGGVLMAGLNKEWSDFSTTQKACLIVGCIMSAASVINAFCSTTMADMRGEDPNSPATNSNPK